LSFRSSAVRFLNEVERPDWDGLDSPSHVEATKIEEQIEALAKKEFGGEFIGT
jgi:hypothetical protein